MDTARCGRVGCCVWGAGGLARPICARTKRNTSVQALRRLVHVWVDGIARCVAVAGQGCALRGRARREACPREDRRGLAVESGLCAVDDTALAPAAVAGSDRVCGHGGLMACYNVRRWACVCGWTTEWRRQGVWMTATGGDRDRARVWLDEGAAQDLWGLCYSRYKCRYLVHTLCPAQDCEHCEPRSRHGTCDQVHGPHRWPSIARANVDMSGCQLKSVEPAVCPGPRDHCSPGSLHFLARRRRRRQHGLACPAPCCTIPPPCPLLLGMR